ncbi:MAG: hypothetical protein WDM78_07820 [Puia sp.]
MSNTVTYLLGAGASADAIQPVVGMKQQIQDLAKRLSGYAPPEISDAAFSTFPIKLQSDIESVKQMLADFAWLLQEGETHITFDTLAKRFYLQGDIVSLNRLKRTLIIYFTIIQINNLTHPSINNTLIDKRYDSFIATIAEKHKNGLKLKGNIKILTWNYDLQFELSLKKYVNQKIHEIKEIFQIFPNHNSFDLSTGDLINHSQFGMVKLNGNAFFDNPSITGDKLKTTLFDEFFENKKNSDFLGELSYQYRWLYANDEKLLNEATRYFNFAWESNSDFDEKYAGHENNLNEAIKIAGNTQVLVIIGYSFPVFNREIDKRLFENMENLNKVYIQDKYPDKIKSTMENAFEIFQELSSIGREEITFQLEDNLNQFVIPFEM